MSIYLDVPFQSQLSFGGSSPSSSYGPTGRRDPTGCWYASACMLGHFFEAGPRLGVPSYYKPNLYGHGGHAALSVADVSTLARNEGLEPITGAGTNLSSAELEEHIRSSGPLWFAWNKTSSAGKSYGHVSVLIGVNTSVVVIHDPEDEPKATMSLPDFNSKRYRDLLGNSSMLRRQGLRKNIRAQVLPKIRAML